MKRLIATAALTLLITATSPASTAHLMPKVKRLEPLSSAEFALGRGVSISDPTGSKCLQEVAERIGLTPDSAASACIDVRLTDEIPGAFNHNVAGYPDEAYSIVILPDTIRIRALTPTGVIRAAQTLEQLALERESLEPVSITDWPAFKVRGFMHDVGRSFITVDELKRQIDMLSRFKINTFHWHLTDNTGWRLQINAYPQLTGPEAITRFPDCYYTQDDAREIQDYAYERGVAVIPEIDMPGHSQPFVSAMGHEMTTPEGREELKVILTGVAELFDKAPYIHIGGDEKGFDDSFLIEMTGFLHSLGKRAAIWNRYNVPARKVNPSLMPVDMTTNWATSGTLSEGVPNIDMRYNYTNHFDLFADPVGIFKSSIFYTPQGTDDVGGTISAAWNDTYTPTQDDITRQNNIYANILASGERAWTGGGRRYIENGGVTLPDSGAEYDEFADWERRFLLHKATTLAPVAHCIPYVRQTDVRWLITDQMPNGGNPQTVLPPEEHMHDADIPDRFMLNDTIYGVSPATGAGIYLRHIWHPIVKGFYDDPQPGMTAYAWTHIYSPDDQPAAALIEFYTYSRSGNEKAPEAGMWDRRGSRIWLNGEELPAPEWEQPGADIRQDAADTGLTNENVTARPPTPIMLRRGWNRVFIKLPHADNGGTGRDKWQFTFVVTDPSGRNALDGIVYSPEKQLPASRH